MVEVGNERRNQKKTLGRSSQGAAGDRILSCKPCGEGVSRGSVSVWDADEISSKMRTRNGPFDLTTRRSNCDLRRATSMKWKTQKPDWR